MQYLFRCKWVQRVIETEEYNKALDVFIVVHPQLTLAFAVKTSRPTTCCLCSCNVSSAGQRAAFYRHAAVHLLESQALARVAVSNSNCVKVFLLVEIWCNFAQHQHQLSQLRIRVQTPVVSSPVVSFPSVSQNNLKQNPKSDTELVTERISLVKENLSNVACLLM